MRKHCSNGGAKRKGNAGIEANGLGLSFRKGDRRQVGHIPDNGAKSHQKHKREITPAKGIGIMQTLLREYLRDDSFAYHTSICFSTECEREAIQEPVKGSGYMGEKK